jgi:hypothetical protein
VFFDNLFWTNSGYGGDPNNLSMLRISKNKWYNFSGSFRRNLTFELQPAGEPAESG